MRKGDIRIGISGWRYPPWRGVFYPEDLPQRRELAYAAGIFRSIEINGTFYSLQRPDAFRAWHDETPDDFIFAVKAPRYITHIKRLRDVEPALANFFASGLLALGPKLGPLLWQLPPNFRFDPERLTAFFEALPRTTTDAVRLARKREARMKGRAVLSTDAERPIRHALEIRHESFCNAEFIRLLRKHKIALVVADAVDWPRLTDVTADFVYCRLHGSKELYASGYGPKALDRWAARILAWASGGEADGDHTGPAARRRACRDVFVYFDNDAKVRAPRDAQGLMRRIAKVQQAFHR